MHTVTRRLLHFYFLTIILWQVGGVKFSRLIELSQHIRHCDDIRSLVVFSQRNFVQRLSGYEMFLRSQSAALPVVLIGDDYAETESLGSLLGSWSLVFVFMDKVDNPNMLAVVNQSLLHIHSLKIIFVLNEPSESDETLVGFFRKCLRLGIVNVISMFQDQVLSYEPYPSVTLINITSAPIGEYFQDHLYDLKGYRFYSPVHQDAARVYLYNDSQGVTKMAGINAEIYRSFVRRHNATFERLVSVNNKSKIDITDGFALLSEGKIDILLHSFSYFNPKSSLDWSYPISQIRWQAVVPYVGEISSYMYLILPFNMAVWICIAVSFVYISLIGYITLRYCRRLTEYGPVFSRSLTLFLYMPSTGSPCTLRSVLLEMQIICYGLILTNIYLAFLSAFLTTTVQGKQIDNLEELYTSGIKIMTTTFESILLSHTDVFLPRYDDVFQIEEMDLINEYRKRLDRSHAFVMAEDRTNFFLGQQKYLENKRWHVSSQSWGTFFLAFSMQRDSPFRKNFDAILLQLYQTGLYTKWERDVFDLAVETKYLHLFRSEDEGSFKPWTFSHLFACWIMFGVGIGLAFGVFLVELVRFRVGKMQEMCKSEVIKVDL